MRRTQRGIGLASPLVATALASGCFLRHPAETAPPPMAAPSVTVREAPPAGGAPGQGLPPELLAIRGDSAEPIIPYMVMADAPVSLVLERIAEVGKFQLVVPPNLKKTISVRYINVPVSFALKDALARSGLRLGTAGPAPLPFDTVTVFYHLPANVDSLSADAIMKRYGVSRAIAELLVKSRKP